MKNNYNFDVVKLHLKFNQRTQSTSQKFQIRFPSQNLILFQPNLCIKKGIGLKVCKINCAYIRLSEEDGKNTYSKSILNQIALIEEYSKKNQIKIHKKYIDDGFSGINFSRPAFEEMLKEMEKGNIETIVTKDFSRLGREYIETTYYITRYFPEHNIRYIAINENYDSNRNKNDIDDIMIGIKGIMNDRYIKETSKKIQEVKKQKTEQGYYMGFIAPYGYKKIKEDNGKITLIPDEKVKNIIQRIFEDIANGKTRKQVAQNLNKEKILSPIQYLKMTKSKNKIYYDKWSPGIIYRIIRNQIYIGNTYKRKSSKKNYRQKRRDYIIQSKRDIVINTHPAIISKELYKKANEKIKRNNEKINRKKEYHGKLEGIVKCGECGKFMKLSGRKRENNKVAFCLYCPNGKNKNKTCNNTHIISTKKIENIIYFKLNEVINNKITKDYILQNAINYSVEQKKYKRKKEFLNKEIEQHKIQIKKLYLNKTNNIITVDEFLKQRKNLNMQIEIYEKQKEELTKEITYEKNRNEIIQNFKKFKTKDNLMNYLDEIVSEVIFNKDKTLEIRFNFWV